ncbi:MAG TPA: tetratricopeptide repeat protein [Kofleriaceae bacterium]|nr:tetratricopeptide repeat protein [Kofleriaceae bacterium]
MRRLSIAVLAVLGLATPVRADADMIDEPADPEPAADRGNFWRNLLTPHRDEVDLILSRARQALQTADMALYSDYDPTGTERIRFYKEIYGMLKYARRLEPDNIEVLRLLGLTADEHGKTREAIEAFQSALDIAGDKAPSDIPGRLGIIYMRLGKLDDAIRYLRMAQGPVMAGQPVSAHVLVHLSNALAARGQMTEAIDVLAANVPDTVQYFVNELLLVSFALAVQYDRDEQRGAAFDVLDKMQNVLQGQLAMMGQQQLSGMRFSPPEDKHYYYALLYESNGNYVEARAEWALYAAAGNLPFRRRALDHISALDAQARAPSADAANYGLAPPPAFSPRIKHPRVTP